MRVSISCFDHARQAAVGVDQLGVFGICVVNERIDALLGVFGGAGKLIVDHGNKRRKCCLLRDDKRVKASKHRDDFFVHNLILPMVANAAYRACGVAVFPSEKDVA